jgi:hypothetical protein
MAIDFIQENKFMTSDRVKKQRQDIKDGYRLALASTRQERRIRPINASYKGDRVNVALSISKSKPVRGINKAIATIELKDLGQLVRYPDRVSLVLSSTYRDRDRKARIKFVKEVKGQIFADVISTDSIMIDLGKIDRIVSDVVITSENPTIWELSDINHSVCFPLWLTDHHIDIGNSPYSLFQVSEFYRIPIKKLVSRIKSGLNLVTKETGKDKSLHSFPLTIDV